jgi:hypothetical protein
VYTSLNVIRVVKSRRMRWAGHVACMEEMITLWLEKPYGKRPLRSSHKWENNIRMYLREIEWESVDWIHLP